MELTDLKKSVPVLSAEGQHNDKIKLFGWFLHTQKGKTHFQPADIGKCYSTLHMVPPGSFGPYFATLVQKKELLKKKTAPDYWLVSRVREALDAKYGTPETSVKISNLLKQLPDKLPDLAERTYLNEALICYTHGSRRAAIVMTWNLTFAHLCNHVLKNRLADFNARWQLSMPGAHKNKVRTIKVMDDFNDELKESEVLSICRDASIITKNIYSILHAALGRRNAAAHPNAVIIDQASDGRLHFRSHQQCRLEDRIAACRNRQPNSATILNSHRYTGITHGQQFCATSFSHRSKTLSRAKTRKLPFSNGWGQQG